MGTLLVPPPCSGRRDDIQDATGRAPRGTQGNNMNSILRFLENDDGPVAVEYSVMLALIIMMAITAIGGLGGSNSVFWSNIDEQAREAFDSANGTGGSS